MSALAIYSLAIAVAIFHVSNINGMKDSDIKNVLGQLYKKGSLRSPLDQSLERDEYGNDVQELLENIARSPQVQIGFPDKDNELLINEKERKDKHGRHRYWPWTQILYVKPAWLKSVYTPRKQNYLMNDMEQEDGDKDLGDYSKVYLVLDPDADITEADVRDLSNMVSSVLEKPSTQRKSSLKDLIQKKRRYKVFIIKDNSRRRMRDSKEKYEEKDSIERDYIPKRSRAEYGGGGGGRTAIPYIGHRGDIFERA
ncbi:uncharacterized protein LOC123873327 [Maniola jurtina]|uniref:uncharacterized protein LOC123873327 n=1 Tax=Maniola jurtina TaxID=191418 RepID=UPI001E68D2D5|nr:uncharacterized protein LOC123873327 [Maniola jurtina]